MYTIYHGSEIRAKLRVAHRRANVSDDSDVESDAGSFTTQDDEESFRETDGISGGPAVKLERKKVCTRRLISRSIPLPGLNRISVCSPASCIEKSSVEHRL